MSKSGKEILVRIEPQPLTPDEFEDYLCDTTDRLFVEYFNAFLALPTWPEALAFNPQAGCFEVVTDSKQRLAEEIKAAVRAGKPRKAIYRAVKKHSFSTIPLIPLEDPPAQQQKEIQTSFTVKALNKEQGVAWIKRERLPSFLESDLYIEYCLAKLISQCQLLEKTEGVSLKVHYEPKQPEAPKVEEAKKENHVLRAEIEEVSYYKKLQAQRAAEKEKERKKKEMDETKVIMKNMFVSMGTNSTTDTEAWVSQVKMSAQPQVTASGGRPRSAAVSTRPTSGRPTSAAVSLSVTSARPPSSTRPTSAFSSTDLDSGFWSAARPLSTYESSLDIASQRHGSTLSLVDEDTPEVANKNAACVLKDAKPNTVKFKPTYHDSDDESLSDVTSVTSTVSDIKETSDLNVANMSTDSIVFDNVNEISGVIVGTVLKYASAEVNHCDVTEVTQHDDVIKNVYPSEKYHDTTLSSLKRMSLIANPEEKGEAKPTIYKPKSVHQDFDLDIQKTRIKLSQNKDSDEDSLLNSDDDYDEERDKFFRKKKKLYPLTRKKGIEAFKKFLVGTLGEKNWNFWIDVERAKLISNNKQMAGYLAAMREHYHKHGAVYELSQETKKQLGLVEPSNWTLHVLISAQLKLVQPLLLYWAPRFVLKQKQESKTDQTSQAVRNEAYANQQRLLTPTVEAYPSPPTVTLLPLRPKTCMPAVRQQNITITSMLEDQVMKDAINSEVGQLPVTAPPVGMPRRYPVTAKFPKVVIGPPIPKAMSHKPQHPKSSSYINNRVTPRPPQSSRPNTAHSYSHSSHHEDTDRAGSAAGDAWQFSSRPTSAARSMSSILTEMKTQQGTSEPSSRPATAQLRSDSAVSEFLGGRRMELLLQALDSDRKAGDVIRKFLAHTDNQLWNNAFNFWTDLQDYHILFYSKVIDDYLLQKKAKMIYSTYIVEGAPKSIQYSEQVQEDISSRLDPPYEDLFDPAEEYILDVLFNAWKEMTTVEQNTFDIVELVEETRHLETKSKYFITLRKRGILKEPEEDQGDPMARYNDPIYDESLLDNIPENFKDYTLEKLIHNGIELDHFRRFLESNYASMDLLCWSEIEAFRRIPHRDNKGRDQMAKVIKARYLNKKYFFGANSPAGIQGQEKVLQAGGGRGKMLSERPPTQVLLEAQKYVQKRLEKKWLPLFLATPEFADRQQPHHSIDHILEDMQIQRKKMSQAIWKMLETKWVSSSKDILIFRKALLNPITSTQFRRFVSIKGDNFENDVLFWQEVQKYKDLCHLHSDRSLILQKTMTIINCFIDSMIPPSLQVDIPQEMADDLLERKMEGTPYLFRDAQMAVFRVLYAHWSDFTQFRSQTTDDKVMPTIERHRRRAKAEERKRRKEFLDKRDKEIQRKRELGIPVSPEEEEFDPFERLERMIGEESRMKKVEPVSWSYSSYMRGLDKEDVLNNVDQTTFANAFKNKDVKSERNSISSQASSRPSSSTSSAGRAPSAKEKPQSQEVTRPNRISEAGVRTDNRANQAKKEKVTGRTAPGILVQH